VFNGGRTHPAAQYCANLGHPTDAETGLVYMRARYYEPWTGRFLSEDPARDGRNWSTYCDNNPVRLTDPTGRASVAAILGGSFAIALWFLYSFGLGDTDDPDRAVRYFCAAIASIGAHGAAMSVEPWILRAGDKIASIMRLDHVQRPGQLGYRFAKRDVRVAFYVVYACVLAFLMEYLEAWAEGTAQ
jgi:RHS repeat-associated protein